MLNTYKEKGHLCIEILDKFYCPEAHEQVLEIVQSVVDEMLEDITKESRERIGNLSDYDSVRLGR